MQESRSPDVGAQAIEWYLRLRDSTGPSPEAAEFSDWLTRSPECVEEYLAVSLAWSAIDAPARDDLTVEALIAAAREDRTERKVVALHDAPTPQRAGTARIRSAWARAAAATIVLALIIPGSWIMLLRHEAPRIYSTDAHQQQSVRLADGSVVTLQPNTRITLRWTPANRLLELTRGHARFQVARNPRRPFVVTTPLASVEDIGTVFEVDADRTETTVRVTEGKVRLRPFASDPLLLSAGDDAFVSAGHANGSRADPPSLIAWTGERLVTRNAPLARAVMELDRHSDLRLSITDSRVAALTISGVLDPVHPEPMLRYLQRYEGVHVERSADGSARLSSGSQPAR